MKNQSVFSLGILLGLLVILLTGVYLYQPKLEAYLPPGAHNLSYGTDGLGREGVEFTLRTRRYVMWKVGNQSFVVEVDK